MKVSYIDSSEEKEDLLADKRFDLTNPDMRF